MRWQRRKDRRSEKDKKRGQSFLFPLHNDTLQPWERDEVDHLESPPPQPSPPAVQEEKADLPLPPDDEVPF